MITNVLSYFESAIRRCPDRTAFADRETSLTYREAWETIREKGGRLAELLGASGLPVGVCIRHNVRDLLAFFAILYSGNFYIPIDPSLPEARVRSMLRTTEPAVVIVSDEKPVSALAGQRVLALGELSAPQTTAEPWKDCKDTDLLYVIFTSGSTGEPKGVSVCHRSVIDMAEQFQAVFRFEEGSVFGNQAPFDFDVSVKDLFLSLKVCGTMEILEKRLFSFPKLLISRLNERRVDTIIWAVPALNIVAGVNTFDVLLPQYLKNVMFSGEVMPPKVLACWMDALPQARFVNLYGPTEITCNCTYYIVDPADDLREAIPIGRAFPNCSVFLLDGDELIREPERVGEICVTGTCLSPGYYRRMDLTAAAFVQNPLNTALPEPMYRTGDLGFYRGGRLMYAGRKDTQIKHMGHRIEMAEIELCANNAEGVSVSACVYDAENRRLLLCYQGEAEECAVMAHLRGALPKYMLPSELRRIDAFPRTRTGKIDRKTLLNQLTGENKHG